MGSSSSLEDVLSKVIAIFGAGTGLGVSMARRFGREGYRVALIARRPERLQELVAQLEGEGIEAFAFPADLTVPGDVATLIASIKEQLGRIDVVEYGPVPAGQAFTSASALTAKGLQELLPLYLLTPVEVIQAVLPDMVERGEGAVLVTHGFSAVMPAPHFSGVGPVMSAMRSIVHSLNGELQGTGVYAGTINVAGAIARSENEPVKSEDLGEGEAFEGAAFSVIDPDDIAQMYWEMVQERTAVEQMIPQMGFGQ